MNPYVKRFMKIHTLRLYSLVKISGNGDRQYSSVPVDVQGYCVGKTTLFINSAGERLTSQHQFMVDGSCESTIKEGDILQGNLLQNKKFPVLGVQDFSRKPGVVEFKVVYLK